MSFESGKTLGGIGALLMVIGSFVPFVSLVGIILLLIGLKRLADYYKNNGIFQNALYGLIFGIVGIVAAALVILSLVFSFAIAPIGGFAFFGGIIVALIVAFIFYLLTAIFYKKSFDILAEQTGEKMVGTAGLLLLIGAVLTIIIIGLLIMFIAWIVLTVAFFSIKMPETFQVAAPVTQPQPPVAVSTDKKYCRHCGGENKTDSVFCEYCGGKL
jgi:uncharacterized membrane protein